MKGDGHRNNQLSRALPALRWALIAVLTGGLVVPAGIGLTAVVGRGGDDVIWARWGSVGEAFGVINSIVSALALAALIFTYVTQTRDLRVRRGDLVLQRAALENAEKSLRRSSDIDLRSLHMRLIGMAIEDPRLAEVLPSHVGTDETTRRQHLYANLLLQHVWLQYTAGIASEEEMVSNVRHLFASPKVREYWKDTAKIRRNVYVPGTQEISLAGVADTIWREYEGLLACSAEHPDHSGGRDREGASI